MLLPLAALPVLCLVFSHSALLAVERWSEETGSPAQVRTHAYPHTPEVIMCATFSLYKVSLVLIVKVTTLSLGLFTLEIVIPGSF